MAMVLTLLWLLMQPAGAVEHEGLVWQWDDDEHRRWYLETEVHLPLIMWFVADQNRQARVVTFQVRTILDCAKQKELNRRSWMVECAVEDFALIAAAVSADEGELAPILNEIDRKLSAATLQVVLRRDGRVVNIDLEGVEKKNRRISRMTENLRLVMARVIAGMDLQLPKQGKTKDPWLQREALLMATPSVVGTLGAAELVHGITHTEGAVRIIESAGTGTLAPGEQGAMGATRNLYTMQIAGMAVFDTQQGLLRERVWTVLGKPTASSEVSEGGAGLPYWQRGRLLLLDPTDKRSVGDTKEVAPPGRSPTTLEQWTPLGTDPGQAP